MVPFRAVPKWLDFSSMVVKPDAPSGRFTRHPLPHNVSAKVTTLPAYRNPFGAMFDLHLSPDFGFIHVRNDNAEIPRQFIGKYFIKMFRG